MYDYDRRARTAKSDLSTKDLHKEVLRLLKEKKFSRAVSALDDLARRPDLKRSGLKALPDLDADEVTGPQLEVVQDRIDLVNSKLT
jgi:hypothetical protein